MNSSASVDFWVLWKFSRQARSASIFMKNLLLFITIFCPAGLAGRNCHNNFILLYWIFCTTRPLAGNIHDNLLHLDKDFIIQVTSQSGTIGFLVSGSSFRWFFTQESFAVNLRVLWSRKRKNMTKWNFFKSYTIKSYPWFTSTYSYCGYLHNFRSIWQGAICALLTCAHNYMNVKFSKNGLWARGM